MTNQFDFICPYCGSPNSSSLDITGGPRQEWVSDCEACCRPILVQIELDGEVLLSVRVRQENG